MDPESDPGAETHRGHHEGQSSAYWADGAYAGEAPAQHRIRLARAQYFEDGLNRSGKLSQAP